MLCFLNCDQQLNWKSFQCSEELAKFEIVHGHHIKLEVSVVPRTDGTFAAANPGVQINTPLIPVHIITLNKRPSRRATRWIIEVAVERRM